MVTICPEFYKVLDTEFQEKDIEAFRWVLKENEEFKPQNVDKENPVDCILWSLSFFDSLDVAQIKFQNIVKAKPYFKKKFKYVFKGQLKKQDGIFDNIRNNHFNYFEYLNVNIHKNFSKIKDL